jgi:hypothetical protein
MVGDLKVLIRQWRKQLAPQVFSQYFLPQLVQRLSSSLKAIVKQKSYSLLGALYLDKIVREFKNFI